MKEKKLSLLLVSFLAVPAVVPVPAFAESIDTNNLQLTASSQSVTVLTDTLTQQQIDQALA